MVWISGFLLGASNLLLLGLSCLLLGENTSSEGEKAGNYLQHLITKPPTFTSYNLGQNCWENCILGQHFSKQRSCTGSSLSPFPWKQCCCVFKRKPDPWVFEGSNIELGEGVFFPQRRCLEIVLLRRKVDMMGKTFSSSFVRDCSCLL